MDSVAEAIVIALAVVPRPEAANHRLIQTGGSSLEAD